MGKVLVAYATWAGSTRSIADQIAQTLSNKKMDVEVTPAKDINSISDYQTIILGTSIHMGKTGGAFNKFLKKFHKILKNKNTAIFVVCANMLNDCSETREETTGWLNKTLGKFPNVKPISIGLFSGALHVEGEEYKKLNPMARRLITSMEESMVKEHGKTDFRDWEKVKTWTEEISKNI